MQKANRFTEADALKLPCKFNAIHLQQELLQLDDASWIDHFVRHNYEGSWNIITLRAPVGETHPIRQAFSDPSAAHFENTPILGNLPCFHQALQYFKCYLKSVRLMKLTPGSRIKEHSDYDLSIEDGTVRLHIPIFTNKQVMFYLNGNRKVMAEGECFYLNFTRPHHVLNKGETDRIHLVIDADVNDWLMSQFAQSQSV
ncbi:aspartyl/asparaginyl beta-hydroxylase domain-containing protein [Thalassotalea euphylliae]|uniref:aspartyl/asparaginyl beta-hydroxylase domain-containing protein n=1 Tax=Thalassotalea euphylliae TaxID=1655234 RepID=UPI003638E7E6